MKPYTDAVSTLKFASFKAGGTEDLLCAGAGFVVQSVCQRLGGKKSIATCKASSEAGVKCRTGDIRTPRAPGGEEWLCCGVDGTSEGVVECNDKQRRQVEFI